LGREVEIEDDQGTNTVAQSKVRASSPTYFYGGWRLRVCSKLHRDCSHTYYGGTGVPQVAAAAACGEALVAAKTQLLRVYSTPHLARHARVHLVELCTIIVVATFSLKKG